MAAKGWRVARTYDQERAIPIVESDEPLLCLHRYDGVLWCGYMSAEMEALLGGRMLVREEVGKRLCAVGVELQRMLPQWQLKVVAAWRPPEIQRRRFEAKVAELRAADPALELEDARRRANDFHAAPEVAGHPAGAAVDLTLAARGRELAMGGKIGDFSNPDLAWTFCPGMSAEHRQRRLLLRALMLAHGFAPFDAEWWHFSFGDCGWAVETGAPEAIYGECSARGFCVP